MKNVLVIPAYNEGRVLGELVAQVLEGFAVDEIIVVDDGSTDGSATRLPADSRVRLIRHARNEGKARALIDGMQLALALGADRILTMDADGQHRPEDIARLIKAAEGNPRTIVVGARLAERGRVPAARYRANRFANFWIAWASGFPVSDSQSGFRLYPAQVLSVVLPRLAPRYPASAAGRRKGFVFESEILIECGHQRVDTLAVRVPALYDTARTSYFRPVADIVQIGIMLTGQLIRRGFYVTGLYRSLHAAPRRFQD